MAKRRRHTPDQIIRKLAEGNKLLAGGAELDEVCRHLQIAESTWHRWLAQYGGMKASDAKRLKELETENTRLKKLLAEAELDKAMLKPSRGEGAHRGLADRLQHEPTTHCPRRPHPERVRRGLDQPKPSSARITTGPFIGARSVARCDPTSELTFRSHESLPSSPSPYRGELSCPSRIPTSVLGPNLLAIRPPGGTDG